MSNGLAHCAQNLASETLLKAQFAHFLLKGVAHWLQNREPAALSVPQFEQRIGLPLKSPFDLLLYNSRLETHYQPIDGVPSTRRLQENDHKPFPRGR